MAGRREFCKVSPAIWSSKRFSDLDEAGKLLMLYFLSCPHQTSAGAFHIPAGYACTDLGWTPPQYAAARSQLLNRGLVLFDEVEEEIYICNWFKFNPVTNPKHSSGTEKLIDSIKSSMIREAALRDFPRHQPSIKQRLQALSEKDRELR